MWMIWRNCCITLLFYCLLTYPPHFLLLLFFSFYFYFFYCSSYICFFILIFSLPISHNLFWESLMVAVSVMNIKWSWFIYFSTFLFLPSPTGGTLFYYIFISSLLLLASWHLLAGLVLLFFQTKGSGMRGTRGEMGLGVGFFFFYSFIFIFHI